MDLFREIADRMFRVNVPTESKDMIINRGSLHHATRGQIDHYREQARKLETAKFKPILPTDFPSQKHAEMDPLYQTRFLTVCAAVAVLTLFSVKS